MRTAVWIVIALAVLLTVGVLISRSRRTHGVGSSTGRTDSRGVAVTTGGDVGETAVGGFADSGVSGSDGGSGGSDGGGGGGV